MKKIFILLLIVLIPIMTFAYPKGDVDGNDKVNASDYILVRKHILKQTTLTGDKLTRADVNGDSKVTSLDFVAIRKTIINGGGSESTSEPTATPTQSLSEADRICESVKNNASIDYKSFASLKKDNDDYYVMKAAHDCANKNNKPIVATQGEYHIYKKNKETITVQTNTNFSGSTIYIHDELDIQNYMTTPIFTIEPMDSDKCTEKTTTGFSNAFASLAPSSGKYFVKVEEKDGTKVLNRNKGNKDKNTGKYYTEQSKPKVDVYRVYNGVVQDPMYWNYNNSKIKYKVCHIPDNQLVFRGATFRTVVKLECKECKGSEDDNQTFKKRGISVQRSNTKLFEIYHSFVNKKYEYTHTIEHKYSGFFSIGATADVIMEKCIVYSMFFRTSSGGHGSTYDISISFAANPTLNKVKMFTGDSYNQMQSGNDWGVMATYETKNLTVLNSTLNRIDAHRNILGLIVKDTVIGSKGITVSGSGDMKNNYIELENVTWKYTSRLIIPRSDYGTTWNGTITMKNCKVENAPSDTVYVVGLEKLGSNANPDLVFNQPIYNPVKITINGLTINSSNVKKTYVFNRSKSEIANYYLKFFQRKANPNKETELVTSGVKNLTKYPS